MKKAVLFALCIVALLSASCKEKESENKELTYKENLMFNKLDAIQKQLKDDVYELYPTKNMWTFLKLNTITGQIWIVQWNPEVGKRFTYELNTAYRVKDEDNLIPGRFSLYPTDNIYNFILMDNISGECWQVQWNFDEDKRFVAPIISAD